MDNDDRDHISWILSGLGEINPDKLVLFERDADAELQAYNYIKRPIHRDEDIMVVGRLLIVPSLFPAFPYFDDFHTTFPSDTHPCRSSFKAVIRFLQHLVNESISEETIGEGIYVIAKHIRFIVRRIMDMDPEGKYAPFLRSSSSFYRLPPIKSWGKMNYAEWLLSDLSYDEEVRCFKYGGADIEPIDGRAGSTMLRETSRLRSFLEKLGYLEVTDLFDHVSIHSVGEDMMKVYLEGNYRSVKHFSVLRDIPTWYFLINQI